MDNPKKTILVIEDSPVQALALLKMFENRNVNILCASNGEAGLEMAYQALPDLVLLDVQMPGINGIEVCHQLRDDPRTRVGCHPW